MSPPAETYKFTRKRSVNVTCYGKKYNMKDPVQDIFQFDNRDRLIRW